MIEHIEYGGWRNCLRLSNSNLQLVATLDVGPRLIRCAIPGGRNLFKEFPAQMGRTGESEWMIRGGHRLWHAPEAKPRTYALDNSPVEWETLGDCGVRLTPTPECETGIQKQMEVTLAEDEGLATIVHRLTNIGPWDVTLAPWALTVMAAGGKAIVPLPPKRPHTEVLDPGFPLVLWPYTDLSDARFGWGRDFITFRQDEGRGPGKFGVACTEGWAAYHLGETLFVKYFDHDPCAVYPDMGCNFEAFSNEDMLEIETLGPLETLAPGVTIEHVETWRLMPDVSPTTSEAAIAARVAPSLA